MKQGMMATLIRRFPHDKWKNNFHELPFEIAPFLPRLNHD